MSQYFLIFLMLLGIFGCGSGEHTETPVLDEDPSEKIIGSWELVSRNGKLPKVAMQQDLADEDLEVLEADIKLIFAADSSLFGYISLGMAELIKSDSVIPGLWVDFTVNFDFTLTLSGSYVVSYQTIELIWGGRVKIDFDVSINTRDIPELQELEAELKESMRESGQEWEAELREAFALELQTYTYDFQGNRLILSNSSDKEVYERR